VPTFTQLPVQHWLFVKQTSPCWVQKETEPEQTPFWHRFEQHCVLSVQPLPEVRQPPPGLTDAHLPPVQIPLQQSDASVQAPATGLSGTHGFAAHCRFDPQ
jgi:hypothetical protein